MWKKTIQGTFGEVREQIDGLAEGVRADHAKKVPALPKMGEPSTKAAHDARESALQQVESHGLQARIAQFAASQITAQHSGEENFVMNVSGEVESDGSGSVTIEYSFGTRKKAKRT